MIVRMSKLEIAGPKELLLEVLETIREQGTFQPEEDGPATAGHLVTPPLHEPSPDGRTVEERLYLENLRLQTGEIISLLPAMETRESWLNPLTILDTISATTTHHLATC